MMTVSVSGINTNTMKALTQKENEKLLHLLKQTKDDNIKEKIFNGNLKLIFSVLQIFKNRIEQNEVDDIFQVASISLLRAIDNFKFEKGCNFSTYAFSMIMGSVKSYLNANKTMLSVSRKTKELAYKSIKELKEEDSNSIQFIAEKLNSTSERVEEAINSIRPLVYLNEKTSEDCDTELIEQLPSPRGETFQEEIYIKDAIKSLKPLEAKVIELRFYQDKNQQETGKLLQLSQAYVSRIERTALACLKRQLGDG